MQIQTPDWVKHAVFYQIFPDRFARSQQPHQRLLPDARWEDWQAMPTLQGYKGGDLWGVAEKLDYLQNLGITAIYFTPIFQSASNHRYPEVLNPNIKLHILPDKGIREEIIAPVNQGAAPTEF
jgi:hypothetical protein